ncbi:MAG: DUF1641 domain-containing protein [Chloroflexi bacterium]|nr:DUF1641 domain-containing protein [Chloroflexota bacterium]
MEQAVQSATVEETLTELNAKIDALTEQVAFLTEQARAAQRRQQEWDELKQDMMPIVNDLYLLSVEQLQEVESYVQLEDILHLFKRLLRNVRNLELLLDQLESLQDFLADAGPLTRDATLHLIEIMDQMERKGYFAFLQEAMRIVDVIVTSFTPEDVRLLGDNVVLILNTVKEMTQPEIMRLLHSLTSAYREAETRPEALPSSTLDLVKQMRDPEVRRGLALTMQMLKIVAQNQARAAD